MNVKCESCLTACHWHLPSLHTLPPPPQSSPLGVWQFSPTKKNHFICRCRCQKLQYLIECLYARCGPSATSVPPPLPFVCFPHLTFAQFHICKQAFAYVAFCQLSARTENSWHVCHEPRLSEALKRARGRQRRERQGERERVSSVFCLKLIQCGKSAAQVQLASRFSALCLWQFLRCK